jgi:hypothetical protein
VAARGLGACIDYWRTRRNLRDRGSAVRRRGVVRMVVVDMVVVFWAERRGTRGRETAVYMLNLWNPCLFFSATAYSFAGQWSFLGIRANAVVMKPCEKPNQGRVDLGIRDFYARLGRTR